MIKAAAYVLAGISPLVIVGVFIGAYAVWRSNRRIEDNAVDAQRGHHDA